jgi:hypothetical protein
MHKIKKQLNVMAELPAFYFAFISALLIMRKEWRRKVFREYLDLREMK